MEVTRIASVWSQSTTSSPPSSTSHALRSYPLAPASRTRPSCARVHPEAVSGTCRGLYTGWAEGKVESGAATVAAEPPAVVTSMSATVAAEPAVAVAAEATGGERGGPGGRVMCQSLLGMVVHVAGGQRDTNGAREPNTQTGRPRSSSSVRGVAVQHIALSIGARWPGRELGSRSGHGPRGVQLGNREPRLQASRYDQTLVTFEEHLMVVWPGDMQNTFPKKEVTTDGKPAKFTWAWLQDMAKAAGCRIDCRGRTGKEQEGVRARRNRPTRLTIRGPPSVANEILEWAIQAGQKANVDMRSVIRQVPRMFDSGGPQDRERAEEEQLAAELAAEDAGPPEDSDVSDSEDLGHGGRQRRRRSPPRL